MKWFLIAALAAMALIPALVSLIPGARKDIAFTENERTVTGMDEYIEREAAIRMLRGSAVAKYPLSFSSGILASAYVLEKLPAADVAQVRHGHWCWEGRFKACSICGSYVEFTETLGASHWKYCPNCGAIMDGDASQKMKR